MHGRVLLAILLLLRVACGAPGIARAETPWTTFIDKGSGIAFRHPRGWVSEDDRADGLLVALSGNTELDNPMEVRLGVTDIEGEPDEAHAKMDPLLHFEEGLEEEVYSKLENLKKVRKETIHFGRNKTLVGREHRIRYTLSGDAVRERWVHFRLGARIYSLNMTCYACTDARYADLSSTFDRMLDTVEIADAPAPAPAPSKARPKPRTSPKAAAAPSPSPSPAR